MVDVPPEDPRYNCKYDCWCAAGTRLIADRLERRFKASRMPATLRRVTFQLLDEMVPRLALMKVYPSASQQQARAIAQAIAEHREYTEPGNPFHESRFGLTLIGNNGTGKTWLVAAVVNALMAEGLPALFLTVPDLLDHLRATYSPGAEVEYDDLFEQIKTVPVLVLDDLGKQQSTPWAKEKLFQLINARYLNRGPRLLTFCTSNESYDELVTFDPAIARRIDEMTAIVPVVGPRLG